MSNFYLKVPTNDNDIIESTDTSVLLLRILSKTMGDMPNIQMKTMGGHFFWDTVLDANGMRLQVNKVSNHARILNEYDERIAWGSLSAMKAKLDRLKSDHFLVPGDVIGIKRPIGYEHYAVYAGNDEVIHFAAENGDFGTPYIHKAPMDDFLDGQQKFFVLDFSSGRKAYKIFADTDMHRFGDSINIKNLTVFSPEETLKRAESVIGANEYDFKEKYNLVFNNCEHFAIWCKTGFAKSYQVQKVLDSLVGGTYYIVGGLIDNI